MNGS
jgi:hypothetical protein